jgi:hypothetical protein
MKNRLARTFNPKSGRTVMLAVDHGYFQGPTPGLERIDLNIVPLLPYCDALFCTRGLLRSVIPDDAQLPVVLRASGGPGILKELSDEYIAMAMDDASRHNAAGVGIQVFIGGEFESRSISTRRSRRKARSSTPATPRDTTNRARPASADRARFVPAHLYYRITPWKRRRTAPSAPRGRASRSGGGEA